VDVACPKCQSVVSVEWSLVKGLMNDRLVTPCPSCNAWLYQPRLGTAPQVAEGEEADMARAFLRDFEEFQKRRELIDP
jgi:hypothetical protein